MNKKIRIGVGVLLCVFALACTNGKKQRNEAVNNEGNNDVQEYVTKSGKKFIVEEDRSMGASISGLKVSTSGFEAVNRVHDFGETDPVVNVFLADLDKNGFEEIYIITRSAGSGSYSNIYGLVSNKDKSATPIYIRPISDKDKSETGIFEGFMGHNSYELNSGTLLNSFPVYKKNDPNAKPSGGIRKVAYRLVAGEAGWILEPDAIID